MATSCGFESHRPHQSRQAQWGPIPDDQDDFFGEDAKEALDDFDRLTEILNQRVLEFADDEEVDDEMLWPLLLRLALTS